MVTVIVPPSIDALSAKNQELDDQQVGGILRQAGLAAGDRR